MRRLGLAAAAVLSTFSLAACSSVRSRESADVESPGYAPLAQAPISTPAPYAPPSIGGPGGSMDAMSLARTTGLTCKDQGNSVLLSGPVLARFFPGSDRMSIDGRMSSMGSPARRDEIGLMIPASGCEAVRRAATEASRPADKPWRLEMPKALPVASSMPSTRIPSPQKASLRPTAGGDPAWSAIAARERDWRWIVVHHSDDESGCCAKYDKVHRDKGWDCCGYDFVIGNGTQTADGQVEVGPRWITQTTGAHAKTPDNRFNELGVGIVLVGDFEHGPGPTPRQYEALIRLTKWLMARYHISAQNVLRHGDCKSTACPGRNFPWAKFIADVS